MPNRRSFFARFQGRKGRRRLLIVAGLVGTALVAVAISGAVLLVGAELWAERSMASGATPTEVFVEPLGTVPPVTDTPSDTPTPSVTPTATATPTDTSTPTATATSTPTVTPAGIQRQARAAAAPAAAPMATGAPTGEHHKKKRT